MPSIRLIYYSRLSPKCGRADIKDILAVSHRNNRAAGVSGLLFLHKFGFIQLLEGGRREVNETFMRIAADRRHRDVTLVDVSAIEMPQTKGWAMALIAGDPDTQNILAEAGVEGDLDPDTLSTEAIIGMTERLCRFLRSSAVERPPA